MATKLSGLGNLLFVVFRALWTSLVILVPAIGVWVASSLAAYQNGPVWLVCLAGLLLFPILPGLWDILSELRKKRKRWHHQVLTTWDRLVLRTLLLNLLFLGGLMWARPEAVFTALSSRGDWPLEHVDHPAADALRPYLLGAADGLQWLYEAAHANEFEALLDEDGPTPTPAPTPDVEDPWENPWKQPPTETPTPTPDSGSTDGDTGDATPPDDAPDERADEDALWPSSPVVHPAVLAMPASAKESVRGVGEFLAAAESDPQRRIKAIHDFTATHVAYDVASYNAGIYPDQSAETVLRTGKGVCAGYANLMKAIGDVTGDAIVVVGGDSRKRGGEISGEGHAWNAAKIGDRWYLIDATWDAGYVNGDAYTAEYKTDYLFTPPALMGITHYPDDDAWQLRDAPLSRGEFTRQPMMRPSFFAQGFTLVAPTRSQVTVDGDVELVLGNRRAHHMIAKAVPMAGGAIERCDVRGAEELRVRCGGLASGTYNIQLYSSPAEFGTFWMVGELQVNVR
ncbi:MAG: transglutaminase domain-containing protein [Nannocystaceae bacterium]